MGLISSGDEYNREEIKLWEIFHVRAIAEFPKPQNITDLRSFMGLTNQLGSFSSAIAAAAQPLRDLLKPRNEWCWTPQHDGAFEKTKEALIAPPVLAHFDASLPYYASN
ncbi:uncharacterized protein LOC135209800 [Macrobrachium nipponense]|uniref:uncharacterized protein LOC135209800 n=1 Tax=Macrobrachium nipponense TaxID=159736 RepID=UPI0030C81BCA